MQCTIINNIDQISPKEWNSIAGNDNPFVKHEFLSALERHHCVGERYGWIPHHIVAQDESKNLVGAVPLYLKDNSYGEFVFDWGWADAYHRSGLEYYPKLVSAIPYTPATGARILISSKSEQQDIIAQQLVNKALNLAKELNVSSLHWLFTNDHDTTQLSHCGFMQRLGCQFHWHNDGYNNFEDFLAQLTSKKRKKIKRERRFVVDSNISIKLLQGGDVSEDQWRHFHRHYSSTFLKLGGYATLSLPFFREIGRTMPDNLVLIMAYFENKPVASAFCLRSSDTLYGRHWGCDADFHSLHFEACYYQGIDYCIREKLKHFEPGAQGEHKISRGFVPTRTMSCHWIANPKFRVAIKDFLEHETAGVNHYIDSLSEHLPFKDSLPKTI